MREVKSNLQIAFQFIASQLPRPPVERVERQCFAQEQISVAGAIELPQCDGFEIPGAEIVGVEAERVIQVFQRGCPILACAINLRQCMVTGGGPGLIPHRLVERGVRVGVATEVT